MCKDEVGPFPPVLRARSTRAVGFSALVFPFADRFSPGAGGGTGAGGDGPEVPAERSLGGGAL